MSVILQATFELPSIEESERRIVNKTFNKLHWFLFQWQPTPPNDANQFRSDLLAAIQDLNKNNNEE